MSISVHDERRIRIVGSGHVIAFFKIPFDYTYLFLVTFQISVFTFLHSSKIITLLAFKNVESDVLQGGVIKFKSYWSAKVPTYLLPRKTHIPAQTAKFALFKRKTLLLPKSWDLMHSRLHYYSYQSFVIRTGMKEKQCH